MEPGSHFENAIDYYLFTLSCGKPVPIHLYTWQIVPFHFEIKNVFLRSVLSACWLSEY